MSFRTVEGGGWSFRAGAARGFQVAIASCAARGIALPKGRCLRQCDGEATGRCRDPCEKGQSSPDHPDDEIACASLVGEPRRTPDAKGCEQLPVERGPGSHPFKQRRFAAYLRILLPHGARRLRKAMRSPPQDLRGAPQWFRLGNVLPGSQAHNLRTARLPGPFRRQR